AIHRSCTETPMPLEAARALRFLAVAVAVSTACTVFDGLSVPSDAGPTHPNDPGCEHCDPIEKDQGTPTELKRFDTRLYWIRFAQDGVVASAELDGGALQYTTDMISNGHDLTIQPPYPYALSGSNQLFRFQTGSTCDPVVGALRLDALAADLLFVK